MQKIENKRLWKEGMSYGGDTWYMSRIFEDQKIEQKKYTSGPRYWYTSIGQF